MLLWRGFTLTISLHLIINYRGVYVEYFKTGYTLPKQNAIQERKKETSKKSEYTKPKGTKTSLSLADGRITKNMVPTFLLNFESFILEIYSPCEYITSTKGKNTH